MLLRILALCGVAALPLMAENLPECKSDEDKIKGCVERLYDNGNLVYEIPYKNSEVEGIWKSYYHNGNLKNQMIFKNGSKDSEKGYYENGDLRYEFYKNGKIEGIFKSYYHNGNLEYITPVKNDKMNGIAKGYMSNGKLLITIMTQENTLISGKCSNGKALNDEELESIKSKFRDSFPYKDIAQICGVKLE